MNTKLPSNWQIIEGYKEKTKKEIKALESIDELVKDGNKKKGDPNDIVSTHQMVLDWLYSQIDLLKADSKLPVQKAMLVICFGEEDELDFNHFHYTGIEFYLKDFLYVADKIRHEYMEGRVKPPTQIPPKS